MAERVGYSLPDIRNAVNQNNQQIENLVIENGNSNAEIVAARTDYTGKTYSTVGERTDYMTMKLNEKLDKGSVSVSDIDKNKGKFDQTYLSDDLLQQIAGDAPVTTVPADKSITSQKYADKSIGISALSEDVTGFEGQKVTVTRSADFENAWALQVVINTSNIVLTGKKVKASFDFLANNNNAVQFWTKLYITSSTASFGTPDYTSNKINVKKDVINSYNTEFTATRDNNLLVLLLWVTEKEKVSVDYYFRNLSFSIEGQAVTPQSTTIYGGSGSIENVDHIPSQVPTYEKVTSEIASGITGYINSRQISYKNGFSYRAKINTQNNVVQPVLLFDATSFPYSVGASAQLSFDAFARSNVKAVAELRLFINSDVTTVNNSSGTQQRISGINHPVDEGRLTSFSRQFALNTVNNGIHVFVDTSVINVSEFADFDLYNVSLKINGQEIPLVGETDIYKIGTEDTFSVLGSAQPDDNIPTVGYVRKTVQEYVDGNVPSVSSYNNLYDKTFNVLGDSMVAGHTLGFDKTWAFKLAQRNKMVVRNYGINGNCLAGTQGGGSGTPMSLRYQDMNPNADYVGVFGLTNDAGSAQVPIGENTDATADTVKGGLNILCQGLTTIYPKAKIFFITPYHRSGIEPYVQAMKDICQEKYGIPVFDNYRNGGIIFSNEAQAAALTMGDGTHLNEAGHEYVSTKYENFMRQL